MATHSNTLAWRIPWTEETGRLQSMMSKESDTTQQLNHHQLEEGMATHFSILAWRIPWTEEPGGPQSMGSQRVDMTEATQHACVVAFRDPTFKGEKVYISCPVFEWTVLNVSSHPLPHLATWKPCDVEIFLSSWEGGEVPGKVGGSWEANSFPQLLGMCLVEVQHVAVGILWGNPDCVSQERKAACFHCLMHE